MAVPAFHHLPKPPNLTLLDPCAIPSLPTLSPATLPIRIMSLPHRWLVASSPSPFPLGPVQVSLYANTTSKTTSQLNGEGDKVLIEELQEWLLHGLLCPEDWRWLWNKDLELDLSLCLTPQSPSPFILHCYQCQPTDHVCPNCQEHTCPYCHTFSPGHPQHSCPIQVCALCREKGYVDVHCPAAAAVSIPSPSS